MTDYYATKDVAEAAGSYPMKVYRVAVALGMKVKRMPNGTRLFTASQLRRIVKEIKRREEQSNG